tara:strand:- start:6109 stop:8004 length:1896 start_codon:yes stop_codon:yes gene_type:complete
MIKLSGYKVIKKIGSGGMGDVYLAEHEVLETLVAIKSLHTNLVTDESFKKRFKTEAKVHAKLNHPNVVKLIDFQQRKDGLFIVMEYVEGKQLDDYIHNDSGPIPEKELLSLFRQIVDAISHAHLKGLVHRDIKPANVIISQGKIKVLDFGIAKEISTESGLTKTGVQVGTPMYMSPEQVNGEKIDKLTDIYSLGITLFYMASGKPPYENSNVIKMGIKIISEPFPSAQEFYPAVSNKLEIIIKKATQKKKTNRYQSCEELIKDLDLNIIVPPKFEKLSTNKKKVKKKNISILSKLLLVVVLLLLIILSFVYFTTKKLDESYSLHYNKAIKYLDSKEYQDAVDEFSECLKINTEADSILYYRADSYFYLDEYEKSINDLSKAILLNSNEAWYYSDRADSYFYLEEYEKSINDFSKAILLNPNEEYYYSSRAESYFYLDEYEKSINDLSKAILLNPNEEDYYSSRSDNYYLLEEYKKSINDLSIAILLNPNEEDYYSSRADSYFELEKYEKSITDFSKAILLNPNEVDYHSFLYRGISYYSLDLYDEEFMKGKGIQEKFFKLWKYARAEEDFTRVISLSNDKLLKKLAYTYRGMLKQNRGFTGSSGITYCNDYQKGCEFGDNDACEWYNDECY